MRAHRVAHRVPVLRRVALGQQRAQLAERARLLGEERAALAHEHRNVELVEARADCRPEAVRERGLQRRAQERVVRRRHQMDRDAHERGAHHFASMDEVEQIALLEALEARPEPHERRLRDLGLQTHQPFEHLERRRALAREQHLPRERRAIELAQRERRRSG